jgi:hypothetical protein
MITEKEWNEKSVDLLSKYSFMDLLNYFVEVEMPKLEDDEERKRQLEKFSVRSKNGQN